MTKVTYNQGDKNDRYRPDRVLFDELSTYDTFTTDSLGVEFKTISSTHTERKMRYERQKEVYQDLLFNRWLGRGSGKTVLRSEYLMKYLIELSKNPLDRKRSLRYEIRQIMEGSNWKN